MKLQLKLLTVSFCLISQIFLISQAFARAPKEFTNGLWLQNHFIGSLEFELNSKGEMAICHGSRPWFIDKDGVEQDLRSTVGASADFCRGFRLSDSGNIYFLGTYEGSGPNPGGGGKGLFVYDTVDKVLVQGPYDNQFGISGRLIDAAANNNEQMAFLVQDQTAHSLKIFRTR
ncbi:MAG: hypothetical protein AB7K68_00135 [Bacteriovoracia bacterium]